MKKIKYIVSIFCFLLVFILTSELYQNYLSNFMDDFYYFSVGEQNDSNEVYDLVLKLADENNIGVFLTDYTAQTTYSAKLDIYMSQNAKVILEREYDIVDGTYKSLFSGDTDIYCHDYKELYEKGDNLKFYFIGDFEQIRAVRNEFNETITAGYIHKTNSNTTSWIIIAVWIVVSLCVIFLTWMDIQFQKKENFIKISLGMTMRQIVIRNIIEDFLVFMAIFALIYVTMGVFVYVGYRRITIIAMFIILQLINAFLYLTLFKYDYKEVLFGANINLKVISNCYILKAVTMIITIVSLSVNVGLLSENVKYLKMYDTIDNYSDYYFMSLDMGQNDGENWEERAEEISSIKSQYFYELYEEGKVSLSTYNTENEYGDRYFLVNNNTVGIQNLINSYYEENFCGYYIFMPSDREDMYEIAEDAYQITMCKFPGFIENDQYRVVEYDDEIELLYYDTSISSDLLYGFETAKQPIMIYPCFYGDSVNTDEFCDILGHCGNDIMYTLTQADVDHIRENSEIKDVAIINVVDRCEQYKTSMSRIVLINSVISVFMLILETFIIITIIRMEYMVKAKELALKKVLGYSIWRKNKQLVLLNLMTAGIVMTTLIIFSLMFKMFNWYNIVLCTIFLILLELVLVSCFVAKTEKQYVPKILKGGCL